VGGPDRPALAWTTDPNSRDTLETDCAIEKLVWEAEIKASKLEEIVKINKTAYDNATNEKKKWDTYLKQLKAALCMHPEQITKKRKHEENGTNSGQINKLKVCEI